MALESETHQHLNPFHRVAIPKASTFWLSYISLFFLYLFGGATFYSLTCEKVGCEAVPLTDELDNTQEAAAIKLLRDKGYEIQHKNCLRSSWTFVDSLYFVVVSISTTCGL